MIYFAEERLQIVGNVGEVEVPGFTVKLVLLKCESLDTPKPATRWVFREFLKADNHWTEIEYKSSKAPTLTLSLEELTAAITEARTS